jgi:hypothetical protein
VHRGGVRAYAHELYAHELLVRVLVCACIRARVQAHAFVRACIRARARAFAHARSRVRMRACLHAHARACVNECVCAYLSITARSTHVRRSRTRSEHERAHAYVLARPLQLHGRQRGSSLRPTDTPCQTRMHAPNQRTGATQTCVVARRSFSPVSLYTAAYCTFEELGKTCNNSHRDFCLTCYHFLTSNIPLSLYV